MGDYDGEIYRSMNDIYGEVLTMRQALASLNQALKELLVEVRGLRQDLQRQGKSPV